MDGYLFEFLQREMALTPAKDVGNWQESLSRFLQRVVAAGMPMEHATPREEFQNQCRQARNASEALLAAANACALRTREILRIDWPTRTSAGQFISGLQGQRAGSGNPLVLRCLSYMDFSGSLFYMRDFYGADLSYSVFDGCDMTFANIGRATLTGTDFREARSLDWTAWVPDDMLEADVSDAKLTKQQREAMADRRHRIVPRGPHTTQ